MRSVHTTTWIQDLPGRCCPWATRPPPPTPPQTRWRPEPDGIRGWRHPPWTAPMTLWEQGVVGLWKIVRLWFLVQQKDVPALNWAVVEQMRFGRTCRCLCSAWIRSRAVVVCRQLPSRARTSAKGQGVVVLQENHFQFGWFHSSTPPCLPPLSMGKGSAGIHRKRKEIYRLV